MPTPDDFFIGQRFDVVDTVNRMLIGLYLKGCARMYPYNLEDIVAANNVGCSILLAW